jgi:GMP synthase-like glutamine amidotransferase
LTHEGQRDRLFDGIPHTFKTFQWHHDSFDIPSGAVLLASSTVCPNQAFRAGSCAWGLQFHPEVTEQIIRDWCGWDSATTPKTEEIVSAFNAENEIYCSTSRHLMGNFLHAGGLVQR